MDQGILSDYPQSTLPPSFVSCPADLPSPPTSTDLMEGNSSYVLMNDDQQNIDMIDIYLTRMLSSMM